MKETCFYYKEGKVYIQRLYLKIRKAYYAEYDQIELLERILTISEIIKNEQNLECEHCGCFFLVTALEEVQSWMFFGVCDECYEESKVFAKDKPINTNRLFLQKGGKVTKEEFDEDDVYYIPLIERGCYGAEKS